MCTHPSKLKYSVTYPHSISSLSSLLPSPSSVFFVLALSMVLCHQPGQEFRDRCHILSDWRSPTTGCSTNMCWINKWTDCNDIYLMTSILPTLPHSSQTGNQLISHFLTCFLHATKKIQSVLGFHHYGKISEKIDLIQKKFHSKFQHIVLALLLWAFGSIAHQDGRTWLMKVIKKH